MSRILSVALMGAMVVSFAAANNPSGLLIERATGVDMSKFQNSPSVNSDLGTYTIVGELPSWDANLDASNFTDVLDLGAPGQTVTGAGYDVEIKGAGTLVGPYGGSWQSEATVAMLNSAGDGVYLTPGVGDDFNSEVYIAYSSGGIIDLVGLGFDFPLPDGKVYMEWFESFDDEADVIDAYWNDGGTLDFEYTPEPASLILLALGALAIRRR